MKTSRKLILKLYVAGQTASSQRAVNELRRLLANELKGNYDLVVIDVTKYPHLAEKDKIIAAPTLLKVLPPPVRKIIGDLTNKDKVLIGLDVKK